MEQWLIQGLISGTIANAITGIITSTISKSSDSLKQRFSQDSNINKILKKATVSVVNTI
ncbi:MAG: hypothetical protein Q8940_21930 [Bacteroidota bacterium]|nr:hypothetical protein [Bacteroidota bacterium]